MIIMLIIIAIIIIMEKVGLTGLAGQEEKLTWGKNLISR